MAAVYTESGRRKWLTYLVSYIELEVLMRIQVKMFRKELGGREKV
jgi:hypothetical protein